MRRLRALLGTVTILLALAGGMPADALYRTGALGNWPQQGYDPQRTSYNTQETVLGPGNVGDLGILWTKAVPCTINTQPTMADGMLYFGHYCGQFLAVDASSGTTLWTREIATVDSGNAVVDGVVYVASRCTYSACGMVYAFDALTGATLWTWDPGFQQVLLPIVSDGVVYVATKGVWGRTGTSSDAHGTQALDAATGEELWTATQGGVAAVASGFVYTTTSWHPDKLAVLDAASGALLWTGQIGGNSVSRPATDGQSVYVNANDGYLYAFDAAGCGEDECGPLWVGEVGADAYGSPQPSAVAEGMVYVGAGDSFYAFEAAGCGDPECQPVWVTSTTCAFYANWSNSPSVANGVVYSTCDNNWIYAFSAASGDVLWSYHTSGGYPMRASPTIAGGRLFHAATFGFALYAFEPPVTTMHVGGIEGYFGMDYLARPQLRIHVLVEDEGLNRVADAVVDASIWAPDGGPYLRSRRTKQSGQARFHWGSNASGIWTLCVEDIVREGYVYAPDGNVVTCVDWDN